MHLIQQLFNPKFWSNEAIDLRDTLVEVLRVVALYIVARFILNRASTRIAQALVAGQQRLGIHSGEGRLRTLIGLIRSVGQYALFFIFIILLLRALGFDAVSVVTSASVAGIAVGIGAQKIVKDVISGFFIIMEDQYSVGDYVCVNTTTGRVEEMGMRIVKIRDDSGRLNIIANGDITQVCNQSRGMITTLVEMGVPPGTDITKVRELVDKAGTDVFESRKDLGLAKAPTLQGIGGGDSTRTMIRAIVQVDDPANLGSAAVALRDAAHAELLEAGITPF